MNRYSNRLPKDKDKNACLRFLGFRMQSICSVLFIGAILLYIQTIFLSDHTVEWNLGRVTLIATPIHLIVWGLLAKTRLKLDESFGIGFTFGSISVWSVLAANYYLADWDGLSHTVDAKVVKVGKYPRRGSFVDIELHDCVKRIDYTSSDYDQLKDRSTLSLNLYNGLLGFQVFKDPCYVERFQLRLTH